MTCKGNCNCSALKEELEILRERKADERKATETIFRLRKEYMKAVADVIELQKVVIGQAREIEQLKRRAKDE
jgi:hypothetical protein